MATTSIPSFSCLYALPSSSSAHNPRFGRVSSHYGRFQAPRHRLRLGSLMVVRAIEDEGNSTDFFIKLPGGRRDVIAIVQCTGRMDIEGACKCNGGSCNLCAITSSTKPPGSKFWSIINWIKWSLGSFLSFCLPFWKNKLHEIEDEVEMVVDIAEVAVQVVGTVATGVEKVASDVAVRLPEEAGKLRDAVEYVEHMSKEVVEDMEIAKDIIHKVDDFREGVEKLLESNLDVKNN